jgi:hypothetical protein
MSFLGGGYYEPCNCKQCSPKIKGSIWYDPFSNKMIWSNNSFIYKFGQKSNVLSPISNNEHFMIFISNEEIDRD